MGSIYKRGSTWTWQFTVGTQRAGNRRTISHGGYPTKKAASLDLADALARFGKGDKRVLVKASTQTLAEYLAGWLEDQRRRVTAGDRKASTIGGYQNIVSSWIVGHPIGDVRLADLDWQVLTKHYDHLRRQGGRPTKVTRARAAATGTKPVGRPLGSRTIQSVHVLLRSALRHAVEQGLLQVNPTDLIPKDFRPTHTATNAEGKHWEPEQARRFLQATAEDRWHALWALALGTGARRGELLALRWADIDWDASKVTISKNRVVVNGAVIEGTPKSKKSRRVDIGPETVAVLRRWRLQQEPSEFVFTDELGEPVRPDRVNHLFHQACARAEVPNIGPHGLRHTAATLWLALKPRGAGVPLHVVSRRLGHANTGITGDLYAHVLEGQQADAAEAGEAVLYGAGSSS
jgi:integrase